VFSIATNFFHAWKKVGVTLAAIEQGERVAALECAFNDRWSKKPSPAENENFFGRGFLGKDPWKMRRNQCESSQLKQLAPGQHRDVRNRAKAIGSKL
jgi:hypothetical protein